MAKPKLTYAALLKMAKEYGVDKNVMFTSACARYEKLVAMIAQMQESIEEDGMMIEKINVKGDRNLDTNPLVPQLPKYMDTANKTLSTMLDIIQRLGREKQVERFADMADDE